MKNTALLFICLIFSALTLQAQNVKIIVNTSNSVTTISKATLSNIFMKKVSKFDNGVVAKPVDQAPEASARVSFTTDVLGKTVAAVKNYWNQQLFSGAGVPPEEKSSDEEIVNYVKANPGAIGYVSSGADINGVKVIQVQ